MKENGKRNTVIIATVEAVVAVFMILAVKVIAPVCSGMLETAAGKQVHMKCYYTGVVAVLVAVLFLVNAAVCFATKQKISCGIMAVALAVCAFIVLNDTMGIGVCANPDMACNVTAPYIKLCSTLELVIGAVSVFLGMKEAK